MFLGKLNVIKPDHVKSNHLYFIAPINNNCHYKVLYIVKKKETSNRPGSGRGGHPLGSTGAEG